MTRVNRSIFLICSIALTAVPACGNDVPAGTRGIAVDAAFPGGNIAVDEIAGDVVRLRPDLRDTEGWWFYWYFRVQGAAGHTLRFEFTDGEPVGVRGAAVSLDEGWTWNWLGDSGSRTAFVYTFADNANSVRFSLGMPYTQKHLHAFVERFDSHPALRRAVLCQSRKGRAVERIHAGRIDGSPSFRVLVTARSHACEMMASYVVEGLIETVLADDADGRWFREHAELAVIPFVDKDGVEDGCQGKNRRPRDHNRDYGADAIYPETQALRAFAPAWSQGRLHAVLDLHCPWIRGGMNEWIFQVGRNNDADWAEQQRFGAILESVRRGPLPYRAKHDLPFGQDWNTGDNYAAGMSGSRWGSTLDGVRLATTFEIPYANASGVAVTQGGARAFGRDLGRALRTYLESTTQPPRDDGTAFSPPDGLWRRASAP